MSAKDLELMESAKIFLNNISHVDSKDYINIENSSYDRLTEQLSGILGADKDIESIMPIIMDYSNDIIDAYYKNGMKFMYKLIKELEEH